MAADRFPATLFTFECGEVCQNAEALLNKRGVPFTIVDVQRDEQGLMRMKSLTGEDRAPVLALGDKIIVKGYSEARWQAALDEAGYPKTPPQRRSAVGGGRDRDVPPPPPPRRRRAAGHAAATRRRLPEEAARTSAGAVVGAASRRATSARPIRCATLSRC